MSRRETPCIDCGNLTRNKRCLKCFRIYQKSDEHRKKKSMAAKAAHARGCWTSQEFREKHSETTRAAWARGVYDQEWRRKKAEAIKSAHARGAYDKRNASEEWRQKKSTGIKAAWVRGAYGEEWRQKNSGFQKTFQNQPQIRRKKAEAIRAAHARGVYGEGWRQKLSEHQARPEIKKRNSEAHCGAKHPNWQGGVSREPYGWEFNDELKEMIRARDDYVCVICGTLSNGRKLSVHHIDYDKKNNDPSNLITLCMAHHSRTSNGDRNYWQAYLSGRGLGFVQGIC